MTNLDDQLLEIQYTSQTAICHRHEGFLSIGLGESRSKEVDTAVYCKSPDELESLAL